MFFTYVINLFCCEPWGHDSYSGVLIYRVYNELHKTSLIITLLVHQRISSYRTKWSTCDNLIPAALYDPTRRRLPFPPCFHRVDILGTALRFRNRPA